MTISTTVNVVTFRNTRSAQSQYRSADHVTISRYSSYTIMHCQVSLRNTLQTRTHSRSISVFKFLERTRRSFLTWLWEQTWPVTSTVLLKLEDISRSQAVTYTVKVVVSRKRCMIETFLLQITNRKWYLTYRIVAILMTLTDLNDVSSCNGPNDISLTSSYSPSYSPFLLPPTLK